MKEPPVKDIFKMDDPEDNITSWTGLLYPASISVFYFYNSYSFIFVHIRFLHLYLGLLFHASNGML